MAARRGGRARGRARPAPGHQRPAPDVARGAGVRRRRPAPWSSAWSGAASRSSVDVAGADALSETRRTVAFRIVQEAVANILRHAEATRVHDRLARRGRRGRDRGARRRAGLRPRRPAAARRRGPPRPRRDRGAGRARGRPPGGRLRPAGGARVLRSPSPPGRAPLSRRARRRCARAPPTGRPRRRSGAPRPPDRPGRAAPAPGSSKAAPNASRAASATGVGGGAAARRAGRRSRARARASVARTDRPPATARSATRARRAGPSAIRIARPWPSVRVPVGDHRLHRLGQLQQAHEVRDRRPAAARGGRPARRGPGRSPRSGVAQARATSMGVRSSRTRFSTSASSRRSRASTSRTTTGTRSSPARRDGAPAALPGDQHVAPVGARRARRPPAG